MDIRPPKIFWICPAPRIAKIFSPIEYKPELSEYVQVKGRVVRPVKSVKAYLGGKTVKPKYSKESEIRYQQKMNFKNHKRR